MNQRSAFVTLMIDAKGNMTQIAQKVTLADWKVADWSSTSLARQVFETAYGMSLGIYDMSAVGRRHSGIS